MLDALRQHMAESAGMTGRYAFTGPLKPGEVQQWLLGNEIDAFVNVSASEGLPVTLMEAARAGIPIIATAVGGNPEIINQTCGFLLTANPPPAEIAAAILGFARLTPERRNTLRDGSRAGWEGRFRAEDNYAAMASSLNEALRTTV